MSEWNFYFSRQFLADETECPPRFGLNTVKRIFIPHRSLGPPEMRRMKILSKFVVLFLSPLSLALEFVICTHILHLALDFQLPS